MKELKRGLEKLMTEAGRLPLSGRRWARLVRIVDNDKSGSIDEIEFQEFLDDKDFVWPELDVVQEDIVADELVGNTKTVEVDGNGNNEEKLQEDPASNNTSAPHAV